MMSEFHSLDVFVFANKEIASLEQVVSIIEKKIKSRGLCEKIRKTATFVKTAQMK